MGLQKDGLVLISFPEPSEHMESAKVQPTYYLFILFISNILLFVDCKSFNALNSSSFLYVVFHNALVLHDIPVPLTSRLVDTSSFIPTPFMIREHFFAKYNRSSNQLMPTC